MANNNFYAQVVSVDIDGDTIVVEALSDSPAFGIRTGQKMKVRFQDLSAPEIPTPAGIQSKAALQKRLASGDSVIVVPAAWDIYGRLVANVWKNGLKIG